MGCKDDVMYKRFSFIYPVTQQCTENNRRNSFIHVSDLEIGGNVTLSQNEVKTVGNEKICFKIDTIIFEGVNVYPLLLALECLEPIESACRHHIEQIVSFDYNVRKNDITFHYPLAKIIRLPLKKKVM